MDPMGERFKNLIDGKWVDSANGSTFDDVSPINKTEVLGSFPRSDHRDVDRAVEAARSQLSAWCRVPARRRSEILWAVAEALRQRREELAALLTRETGKVLAEARMELEEAAALLYAMAGEGVYAEDGVAALGQSGPLGVTMRLPAGVVALVTHWAFPVAASVWKLAAALAAGNTVVFKPAEDAPLMAARLVEIFLEAGLAPGVIGLVHGQGEEAGAPLIRHPDVALVSFVGSPEVGREVAIACAAEQKQVSLELGEQLAILILDDADLEMAVEGTVWGGFAMAGQRWRGAARVLVARKVAKEFAERVVSRVQAVRLGDGLLETTDMGPVINEAQLKRVHGYTRVGQREGAKLLAGGEIVKEADCKRGFFYAPTVFGDATLKMRIVQEEVRGPTVVLVPVTGLDEAVELANSVRRGLTAAVYTRDISRAFRAVEGLRAASVYVNPAAGGPGTRPSLAGFGQLGRIRREAAAQNLDGFAVWKTATLDPFGKRG
jgi:acyl-CoA reductase-like NAD-dependent aldehyde dehydrogenase